MGLLVYSITGKKFVLFILLCLLYFIAVAIRKPNSISDKSSLILERGEKSSVFLCYLSLSFHPLKQAHLFFTITMARLFKVTWSGKVDWPNPKQSVVLAQKAENTKGFKFVLGLGLQGLSSRPCPVPCLLCIQKLTLTLLWFRIFWCLLLILPKGDFWFCCFHSCMILIAWGALTFLLSQDEHVSENILFWDQFTCMYIFPIFLRWLQP